MNQALQAVHEAGVVPVVVIEDASQAAPLARSVRKAGLKVLEITFRTAAAEEAIALINKEVPDMLLGAGTVLSTDQAARAVAAGSRFIVTPGFSSDVVRWCQHAGVPITPGIGSATDLQQAYDHGLDIVKFFPAEALGGLKMLKAISAPFPAFKFIPTGGIKESNLAEYLEQPSVFACGGSWMVKKDLIKAGDFAQIEKLVRGAVKIVRQCR